MLRRGTEFWRCVITGEVPVDLPPVPAPIIANRTYDFSENNQWCSEAFAWLENRAAADKCKDAEKILKTLVPEDAKKVTGAGVYISRDRVGRLSLRADK
jgi:hypothetical protein